MGSDLEFLTGCAAERGQVGGHPFRARALALQSFTRIPAPQCLAVQQFRTGHDEGRRARRLRVRRASGLDELEPGARHRHVKCLGMAVGRGQASDAGGQTTKRLVACVAREIQDREPHVVCMVKLGQRCRLESCNQIVRLRASGDCTTAPASDLSRLLQCAVTTTALPGRRHVGAQQNVQLNARGAGHRAFILYLASAVSQAGVLGHNGARGEGRWPLTSLELSG